MGSVVGRSSKNGAIFYQADERKIKIYKHYDAISNARLFTII